MKVIIKENNRIKALASEHINYIFNKITGETFRWGKTFDDDNDFSPVGPLIADIEASTICSGIGNAGACPWCYKSNTSKGINLSFQIFKEIFDKMPRALTQIAFGADAKCESNPEIWKMMDYCRENGVIPNITVADVSEEVANKLAVRCGAVSVSNYGNHEIFLRSIHNLHKGKALPGQPSKVLIFISFLLLKPLTTLIGS